MRGRMMEVPLLVSSLIEHAGTVHPSQEIVTRTVEGPIHRSSWGDVRRRSRQLASALTESGIGQADRIATLGWNTHRHLEVYYGVSGMGAVCHTLNPRLHPGELVYIMNHAEDRILFVDLTFVPLVEAVADKLASVERYVILTDAANMPDTSLPDAVAYDDFGAAGDADYAWPELDEHAAAALCYTSGTTGHPKGVLYSNRSTVLHALGVALPDIFNLSASVRCLPIVPLFHACAWGLPYATAATGAGLVMPGPGMDPSSLTQLLTEESVDFCAGVPSVFHALVQHWRKTGSRPEALRMVLLGGAAPPKSLIQALEDDFGIEFRHGWGMTETSPLGSVNTLAPRHRLMPAEERANFQTKQGQPPYGVELRIVDSDGNVQPHDGEAIGELQVRGPWVVDGYFRSDEEKLTSDRWFPTGDVASIDQEHYVQITDRTKDLIKSGGEWISSIDVENAAAGHPDIDVAAVIGVPDAKWGERPLLIAVAASETPPSDESVLEHLSGTLAKWQLPDRIVFVDALPMGATGKVQKTKLREEYVSG
ncbi:MAG: long-chain fatty acid--CoA ligase [Longimicrobiales bacterium]|nr:long-chain fatty acid--CoA ligase [Longimicrobiales bacterium]